MDIINMILADPDEEYIHYLSKYIRNSEQPRNIVVKSFSKLAALKSCLEQKSELHILLIHSDWLSSINSALFPKCTVVLCESDSYSKSDEDPYTRMIKYQPMDQFMSNILSVHLNKGISAGTKILTMKNARTKVISIYSSTGGCGKTTVAVNVAKQLAAQQKKVFYLNLESISSASMYVHISENDDFAQLLYYVKTKPIELGTRLEPFIKYESALNCSYLQPAANYKDAEDITKHDIQSLIQAITALNLYDAVVMDLDSSLHERAVAVLHGSDHIVWLMSDDIQCIIKTKKIKKELELLSNHYVAKSHFILNKFTGTVVNDFNKEGIYIQSHLPYIPQWKSVDQREHTLSSDVFNRHIAQLCQAVNGVKEEITE